jgi:hypothetical protein
LDTAINTARRDIAARGKSIVGNNPFLKNAYPDIANAQHQVGDRVTLKDGSTVVIKSITPDGKFNY